MCSMIFENVLSAAKAVHAWLDISASLYHYKDRYYLYVSDGQLEQTDTDSLWSIFHEYGNLAVTTKAVLDEYGKLIVADRAIETLLQYFN